MKNNIITLATVITILLIVYLLESFILMELNPYFWSEDSRIVSVCSVLIFLIPYLITRFNSDTVDELKEQNKKSDSCNQKFEKRDY